MFSVLVIMFSCLKKQLKPNKLTSEQQDPIFIYIS